ncbi:NADH-quinone oxidoreductase subunit NuoE [Paracoccus tegillarcae]|uniref:NADH-quinone oxidoreductase subunit NuoE n=1 Tax=Paracoccus tegillarcae TaxID=1529068 RepID=A0A2K9F3S2_9RHOB|nr:NADH-quinone oxidoreductase subunit NuoE [Paracoccus tegillarcae]AUH35032.1 NADH-quinone oxidoreductase subunit NuoE [Paracoccus tegillarcae]
MLRRLSPNQPDSFEFTPANLEWARAQMTKYPEGRQQSAIIPILWRAQEQEGWLSRPAMEYCADLLDIAYIRALEVATFYFMFQLQPVGSVVHIQICGTTTCMICGAEDLIRTCREKIAPNAHELSPDGRFSWEEVECLGACTNAPMVQIGKDFYEDLTVEKLSALIDAFADGDVPMPGPQNGRFSCEPLAGLTSLTERKGGSEHNASVAEALRLGDTIKRIDGTEVPILTKWQDGANHQTPPDEDTPEAQAKAEAASDSAGEKGADEAAKADENKVPDLLEDEATKADGESAGGKGADSPAKADKAATPDQGVAKEAKADTDTDTDTDSATNNGAVKAPAADQTKAPDQSDGTTEGTQPQGLDAARDGKADDLKMIKGVGPKLETLLNSLGFWHFDQIGAWTADELAWVDSNLEGFHGRASRDEWVTQAKQLAEGKDTEFSRRAEKDGLYD